MKRKIQIAGAAVVGAFFILGIAIYGYLKSDHAKNMIIKKINTVIPGTLAAENINFSMLDSYIKLTHVQLKDPQQKNCFKFNSLLVDVNISALFNKKFEVTRLVLNQPDVSIFIDGAGRINLVDALIQDSTEKIQDKKKTNSNETLPVNIIVKKLEILDGTISFRNPDTRFELNAVDINVTDADLQAQALALTARFAQSRMEIKDEEIRITGLELVSNLKNGSADFTFNLDSNVCKINAKGLAKNLKTGSEIALDANVTSKLEQLNPFLADQVNLGGVARITLSGNGRIDNPFISIDLDVSNLTVDEDINDNSINVSVKLDDRIVSIEKGRIRLLGNTILLKGSIDCMDVFPKGFLSSDTPVYDLVKYDLGFDQTNNSLKAFEKWVPGISGRSTSSGRIKGHGINPKTLAAHIQTKVDLKDFKQASFETDYIDAGVELDGNIENGRVKLTALTAKTPGAQAGVTGQFNVEKNQVDAILRVTANDLAAATRPLGITDIHGAVTSKVQVKGHLSNPDVKIMISGDTLKAGGIALDRFQFDGFLDTLGRAAIQKMIVQGPHFRMNATGAAHVFEKHFKLKDTITGNFKISGININPAKFLEDATLDINTNQLDTLINFNLNMDMDYAADTSFGKIDVSTIDIPIQKIAAGIDLGKKKISVVLDKIATLNAALNSKEHQYTAGVTFDHGDFSPLLQSAGIDGIKMKVNGQINAAGKIPVELTEDVVEALNSAHGRIDLDARMSGRLKEPDFRMAMALSDLAYDLGRAGISISNVNGRISLSDEALTIDNIKADLNRGHLNLNGKFGLENYKPVSGALRLKGDQIGFELQDMARIEFSSDLAFYGTPDKSGLSGTILFNKAEYYKDIDFDLAGAISEKKRKTSPAGKKNSTGLPFFDKTTLDIDIDYKDPFIVDNNLAFILMEPDVNISGTVVNPVVTGRAKIIEGTIVYQKKEFEIDTGIIDFADPYKIDPDINLVTQTQIRDWTVNLNISGKTNNLRFQLFSDPKETHEDILSLLIAGKTTKELGKSNGSYTDALIDKAADIIGQRVEDSTPLDSFKVGYGGGQDSQGSNVSVSMGKKLSKRLEVIYSMETKDEKNVQTTSAEYKLLENLIIKAMNDSEGDFGTEFTYKLEFR